METSQFLSHFPSHRALQQATEQLLIEFERCSEVEQLALYSLSYCSAPIYKTMLASFLTEVNDKQVFFPRIAASELDQFNVKRLVKCELLQASGHSTYRLNQLLCTALLQRIGSLGLFTKLANCRWGRLGLSVGPQEVSDTNLDTHRWYMAAGFSADAMDPKELPHKDPRVVSIEGIAKLWRLLFFPFNWDCFINTPANVRYLTCLSYYYQLRHQNNLPALIEILDYFFSQGHQDHQLQCLLFESYLFVGDIIKARQMAATIEPSSYSSSLKGWLQVLEGNFQLALKYYDEAYVSRAKTFRSPKAFLGGVLGVFYIIAVIQQAYTTDTALFNMARYEIHNGIAHSTKQSNELRNTYRLLELMVHILEGSENSIPTLARDWGESYLFSESIVAFDLNLGNVMLGLFHFWHNQLLNKELITKLTLIHTNRDDCLSHISGQVLSAFHIDHQKNPNNNQEIPFAHYLVSLIEKKSKWMVALDALIGLKVIETVEQPAVDKQLYWVFETDRIVRLNVYEQKMGKKGWSKGRKISVASVCKNPDDYGYASAADKKIIAAIDYAAKGADYFDYHHASLNILRACIGHPNLFFMPRMDTPIQLSEAQPSLLIVEDGNGYKLTAAHMGEVYSDRTTGDQFSIQWLGSQEYQLLVFDYRKQQVLKIIGKEGLKVPAKAKDKVIDSISAIATLFDIQSDIPDLGEANVGMEEMPLDNRIYIDIQQQKDTFQFRCSVRPLGELGPRFTVAEGNETVMAKVDDKRLITKRNIPQEQQNWQQLQVHCPVFEFLMDDEVAIDGLEHALETLEQLSHLQHSELLPLVLSWPKGKGLRFSRRLTTGNMQVKIGKSKDFFSVEGELTLDDGEVLQMKQLLGLMTGSQGRFIQLDDETYLTLTDQLRRQLQVMAAATYNGKFHAIAVPVIDEAIVGMGVISDSDFDNKLGQLKQAYDLPIEVPKTLQASLRNYQRDGYEWASRLAHWGGGACLADDMGLGKTIQALAVIVERAGQGPSLVLAPTSVCFNWQDEAKRFAPTLKVALLSDYAPTERAAVIESLGAFDLLVSSYGLLQNESERFEQVRWHTIVVDEAQAIKNPEAKRSKSVFKLQGDFKMITTGTPIENNLTELWSLFNFINPGLLGSKKQFQTRFISVIENPDKDKELQRQVRDNLRRLIRPFILRRLKTEVLTELPSRTEINLHVELSQEEMTFYEALRQQAMENLQQLKKGSPGQAGQTGQARIKVLAEIMRLRRACCHPRLIAPNTTIEGSKLKVFDSLVEELIEGNHRALVFSQFIDHLAILRAHLDEKGIRYQYLDGSTPPEKRRQSVGEFQAGEGDLFLISLKAGGSGLNLTGADYVIHMDPWWNPAVEDQASDRAHRMGQTRPVTIYRLISKHTIEDKIVGLHQQKRDLADSLLEGTDSAGNISLDDMMQLLVEESLVS